MTGSTSLSRDTAFEVMSNSRRRYILSTLRQSGSPVELMRLARGIGAEEADTTPSEIDTAEQKRIYVSLYQTHIPTLESAGLVEYDQEDRTVAPTPAITATDRYLGPVSPAFQWPRLNGVASVGTGVLLLGAALVGPGVVPSVAVATAVVGVLVVVTVAQVFDHRRRRQARPPELQ